MPSGVSSSVSPSNLSSSRRYSLLKWERKISYALRETQRSRVRYSLESSERWRSSVPSSRRHGGTAVPTPRRAVGTLELALPTLQGPEPPDYDVHGHMVVPYQRSVKP